MLVSISVVFLLCHFLEPMSHSVLYGAIFGECAVYTEAHLIQVMVTNTLEMFSYASNFVFYCIFHLRFRRFLKRMLCCQSEDNMVHGAKPAVAVVNVENGGTYTRNGGTYTRE